MVFTALKPKTFIELLLSLTAMARVVISEKKQLEKGEEMTRNQIEYWNYKETGRHNVATETETKRHNIATETETNRHNVVTEGIDLGHLAETQRHNLATESESKRHNVRTENLTSSANKEVHRHNVAGETETSRHNVAQERIGQANVGLGYANLSELQRHNAVSESQAQQDLNIRADQQEVNRFNAVTQRQDQLTREQSAEVNNALTELKTRWENSRNQMQQAYTVAQINEINSRIAQIDQEVKYGPQSNARAWVKTVTDSINSVGKLIH